MHGVLSDIGQAIYELHEGLTSDLPHSEAGWINRRRFENAEARIKAARETILAALTPSPLPATQEDAERSGVVTQEEVDAALAKFDGGLRRQSDERNARGYTTFYHPKDSMREVLEDFYARRKSTPQRQEYDGEAVREALKEAYDFIASQFRDPSLEAEGEWLDKEARPIIAKISAALAHPAQATPSAVSGDAGEGFDREWCITMAKKEAGHDIGAGVVAIDPSFPEQEGGE